MDALSQDVIHSFIELTEKIANSRTNYLDFGAPDMQFYRGEIHMIKIIGDEPGIFSSKIARRFGITRAVVHKTLLKLEGRQLVTKAQDHLDKKRYQLFLTDKGMQAYVFHEQYHEHHDRALLDYIHCLSQSELQAIKGFLKHANQLIQNHA